MIEKYLQIANEELKEILSCVQDEPVFFEDEETSYRLVSKDEIENYPKHLGIQTKNIIPLIDLSDNNFLIYDIKSNAFQKMDISNDFIYNSLSSIKKYIELIQKNK